MEINVGCKDFNGHDHQIKIPHLPDTCPICHHAINPNGPLYTYINNRLHPNDAQLLFRCTRRDCQNLFIASYRENPSSSRFEFLNSTPKKFLPRNFSETILELSLQFTEIYNEASSAETNGLMKICGVGYRKALEFLIKDYLIKIHPEKEQEIKSKFLGKCITEYIPNENIKAIAKRATWLGNDETHYIRIWEGKDLEDLKKLIDLTLHWIEMEQLTQEVIKDMPDT